MIADWIAALDHPDLSERIAAENALIAAGPAAHPALIAAAHSESVEQRWRAASALGDGGGVTGLEALIALLADPTWEARSSAAYALGVLAEATAFDALVSVASHTTPDEQTPYVAALGLLRMDRARARTALDAAAQHEDEPIRRTALSALAYDRWMTGDRL